MNFNLSTKEKIILLIGSIIIIFAAGINFLIIPAAKQLGGYSKELMATQIEIAKTKQEITDSKNISSSITKAFSDASAAADPFLPIYNKASLNVWLFGLAEQCGLKVNSAELSDPVASTPGASVSADSGDKASSLTTDLEYNMKTYADIIAGKKAAPSLSSTKAKTNVTKDAVLVKVTMSMDGDFEAVNKFLDAVKGTKKYIVTDSFTCSNKSGNFSFDITINCYSSQKLTQGDNVLNWLLPEPGGQNILMK
ncbi:MAG TPA: hypothetical protein VHO66_02505 [Ruminiclostridium sp.]|nr:hypothetical protein [Ruminiclostridium sp.]